MPIVNKKKGQTSSKRTWFGIGYDEVSKRNAEIEASQNKVWRPWSLWIPPGESVSIRFLMNAPFTFYGHDVKHPKTDKWVLVPCFAQIGEPCPLCEAKSSRVLKGAYLVIDFSEWEDRDGNVHSHTVKPYVRGTRDLAKLESRSGRYSLTDGMMLITRTGTGTATSHDYEFDKHVAMSEVEQAAIAEFWLKNAEFTGGDEDPVKYLAYYFDFQHFEWVKGIDKKVESDDSLPF